MTTEEPEKSWRWQQLRNGLGNGMLLQE